MIDRVITDADLLQGRVTGPIVLGPGVLLTPAARDRAVALGIEIREPGAAASTATDGGVGARHGAAVPEGLADGVWLVRVEGGRPVSVLPATGPGGMHRARDL